MTSGRLGIVLLLGGVVATLGAVACSASSDNGADATNDLNEVAATGASDALNSTLILDAGCTAAKVGPRQLLLAARCVSGNTAFAAGQVLSYKIAAGAQGVTVDVAIDAGTDAAVDSDAGDDDDASTNDAGTDPTVTIASVTVHPTFAANCATADACAIGSISAGGVKDIAIVTLTADLTSVPTIPIDLDTVGQADPVLTVGSGCSAFDGTPGQVHTTATIAVPAKTSGHFGSPFQNASMAALRALDTDYVVTPAVGWQKSGPGICRGDIGAPMFRADKTAVAGITAGFTTYDKRSDIPVTLEHTRVDESSQVGTWAASLGATTIHSCNGACAALAYDGGMPDLLAPPGYDGGGLDASAFTVPTTRSSLSTDPNTGASVPAEPTTYDPMDSTSSSSSCSATPGLLTTGNRLGLAFGVALALGALRRRRG